MFFAKGEIIMNNIYKVIWSKAKNCYVVASEIAKSHTKSASGSEKMGGYGKKALLALVAASAIFCGGLVNVGATVHVNEGTGATSEVYTTGETYNKTEVDLALAAKGAANDVASNRTDIDNLKTAVGGPGSGLTKDVADQKVDIATNRANINNLDGKLAALTTTVSGKADEAAVTTALDSKADTDLSNLTAAGETKIKDTMSADMANKADVTTVTTLEGRVSGVEGKVTALEGKVGDASSGLVKDVADLKTQGTTLTNALGNKADQSDLDAANEKITKLETKTGNLSTDGKSLTGMDAVSGTTVSGDTVNAGSLKVTGEISNGNGVTTTLEKINASMEKTNQNADKVADLEKKTTRINYDAANDKTTINGVGISNTQVDMGGKDITNAGALTATGKVTGEGVDAGDGAITTAGAVNAGSLNVTDASHFKGDVTMDNKLSVTGDTSLNKTDVNGALTAKGDVILGTNTAQTVTVNGTADFNEAVNMDNGLTVTGATQLKNTTVDGNLKVTGTITTDKMIFGEVPNNYTEIDKGKVTSKNLVVNGAGQTISSSSTFDVEKNEVGFGNGITGEQSSHKQTSDVITDTVKNNNTGDQSFHKQTSDVIMDNVKDGKNSNNRTQTKTETKDIITDEKGNSSTTSQTASENKTYLTDKDRKNTNSTIDTAKEYDKTIKGENGKTSTKQTATDITNTAKDGTITNTAKNVTNEGTESVTNKVGNNEVKVSTDGVDIKAEDGKKITESVGTASRVVENDKITDKAADSTVTTEKGKGTTFGKEGSTGTTNIYGDSIKTGKINAEDTTTDKLTAGAAAGVNGGRLTVDAKDGVKGSYKSGDYTSRSYILENTLKSGVDNDKDPIDADFVGSRTDHYMVGDKAKLDETVKDADGSNVTNKTSTSTATTITDGTTTTKTEQDTKDITNTAKNGTITNDAKDIVTNASNSITEKVGETNVTTKTTTSSKSEIQNADTITSVQQTEKMVQSYVGKKDGSATNVTTNSANASANQVTENGQISTVLNNKDGLLIQNNANGNSFTTADGTNTGPALEWTNIKGNEISTGKVEANYVKMGYADVMKDLGVHGNATVKKDLTVKGTTNLKNTNVEGNLDVTGDAAIHGNQTIDGTLKVTKKATFENSVDIAKDLSVVGDVTANSYKVGRNTYIDANGINANNQKITNVADGSISEGSKDAVNGGQLYNVKNDLEGKVNKVGANAAAMANLHPMEFDPDSKWNIAAAIGNYGSETAAALGAFYRPNDDVMVNLSTAFGTGENMVGGGVSVRLGKGGNKLSREETNQLKAQVADLTARMDALLSVLNPNMSKDFPDVPENHWAYEAVSRLAGNDIVQGYPDGEFHGERTMTRYEMAEIIYNALSRGAEAERELVEEFKPELQAMAASEKATAEKAEG